MKNPTTSADDLPVWRLQDRIEDGTLTPHERKAVSRLVGAIGALGDTNDQATALGHWQHARELLQRALGGAA
jgi:hypothetical protein